MSRKVVSKEPGAVHIIERYFFVDTDVFHCDEIMCASFIYSDTTIGAAGMINLTWGSGLES